MLLRRKCHPPPQPTTWRTTQPNGTNRYKVAETCRLRAGLAEVTIIAGDWLDLGTYAAAYQVGDQHTAGSYVVYHCQSSIEQIGFMGTFTRDGAAWT